MTRFATDVPLENAMLVWNPWVEGGNAAVIRHPDALGHGSGFMRATGACFANPNDGAEGDDRDWPRMSTDARMKVLLAFAWQATMRDGVLPISMHHALQVIPEFRELMTPDMLSREYRDDDEEWSANE